MGTRGTPRPTSIATYSPNVSSLPSLTRIILMRSSTNGIKTFPKTSTLWSASCG